MFPFGGIVADDGDGMAAVLGPRAAVPRAVAHEGAHRNEILLEVTADGLAQGLSVPGAGMVVDVARGLRKRLFRFLSFCEAILESLGGVLFGNFRKPTLLIRSALLAEE